eukprot:SAG11_NODE_5507_length_1542_cov_0.958420_2_plen_235_part_00
MSSVTSVPNTAGAPPNVLGTRCRTRARHNRWHVAHRADGGSALRGHHGAEAADAIGEQLAVAEANDSQLGLQLGVAQLEQRLAVDLVLSECPASSSSRARVMSVHSGNNWRQAETVCSESRTAHPTYSGSPTTVSSQLPPAATSQLQTSAASPATASSDALPLLGLSGAAGGSGGVSAPQSASRSGSICCSTAAASGSTDGSGGIVPADGPFAGSTDGSGGIVPPDGPFAPARP